MGKGAKQWVVWNYLEPFSKHFENKRYNKSGLNTINHTHSMYNNNNNKKKFKSKHKWVIKQSNMTDKNKNNSKVFGNNQDNNVGSRSINCHNFQLRTYNRNDIKRLINTLEQEDRKNIKLFRYYLIKCIRTIYLIVNLESMIKKYRKIPKNKMTTLQKLWHIDWQDKRLIKKLNYFNSRLLRNQMIFVKNSALRELREYKYRLNKTFEYMLSHIDMYLLTDIVFDFINTKAKSVIYKLDIAMQYKYKREHLFNTDGQAYKKLCGLINWIKHEMSIVFKRFTLKHDILRKDTTQNLSNDKKSIVNKRTLRNRKHRQRYKWRKKHRKNASNNSRKNSKCDTNKKNKKSKKYQKKQNNITNISGIILLKMKKMM